MYATVKHEGSSILTSILTILDRRIQKNYRLLSSILLLSIKASQLIFLAVALMILDMIFRGRQRTIFHIL
jgi:hypothetical protein